MERGKTPRRGRRADAAKGRASGGKRPRKDKPRESAHRGRPAGGKQVRDGRARPGDKHREGARDRRGKREAPAGGGRATGGKEGRERPAARKRPPARGGSRREWRDGPAPGESADRPAQESAPRQRLEVRRKTPPVAPPAKDVREEQPPPAPPPPIAVLEQRLGHSFADAGLLRRALTHSSASADNYERLEFLGDAALGFVVGRLLFQDMPDATEQRLTLMRSHVVNAAALTEVANALELGAFLVLGTGERRDGGAERPSIVGDALEAVLGAVLCDGGLNAAGKCVRKLFANRLASARDTDLKDAKTRLQEHLQQRGLPLPRYEIAAAGGLDHAPVYAVECVVEALGARAKGVGGSRREAEKQAAAQVVAELEKAAPLPAGAAPRSVTDGAA